MKIKRQAGKYDLDFTPVLWACLAVGMFVAWILFIVVPWFWDVIKPWLHTISGG